MIGIEETMTVEGKYDRTKLFSTADGLIIEMRGFRIFKGERQMVLIRRMAETHGLSILTDSGFVGFLIRHHPMSAISEKYIKYAYIPDVLGRERRKVKGSKEGKLGVEGVSKQQVSKALDCADVPCGEEPVSQWETPMTMRRIGKIDLSRDDLTGRENSAQNRRLLPERLSLPEHLTTNTLPKVLNNMMTYEEYGALVRKLLK